MTSPGGSGPIETAYIEIKPQVSTTFAKDLKKELLPVLKKIRDEAEKTFESVGTSAREAGKGVSSVTRSLNSASKAAEKYATNAKEAANANDALRRSGESAQRSLRNIGGAAGAASRGTRDAGTSFNFLTRALVIGAVYEAGHALESLGEFGLKAAADLEQTKIAFNGLFGNTADADAFTKKLQDFANKTPFEFPELAKASQRLLALGQSGDDAIKTLTIVGNAAAAVGADQQSINRVVTALAQIQAKGKLSAEEINQVGEALPNLDRGAVTEILAKKFGKTTQEIQKLQQQGLIPAQAGVEALLTTLQNVPGAMGAMDRQALTLTGRLSTFKDTIKANFANALQDALPILGDSLLKLTDTISTQLDTLGPAIADALVGITPLVEGFVNFLGPLLTDFLGAIVPLVNQIGPALAPIGEAFGTIVEALGPALEPLAAALAQVAIALAPVIALLGVQFANALVAVTPLILMFVNALIPFLNFLVAHPTLLGDLAIGFAAVFAAFKGYAIVTKAVAAFKALAVSQFAAKIAADGLSAALRANPVGAVITAVSLLATGFVLLYRHSETFRNGIKKLKEYIVPAIKFIVDALIEYFTFFITIAAKAFGWIPGLGPKLKAAENAVDDFKNAVNKSIDGITKRVDIQVVTTYTVAEQKEAVRLDKRQQRINKALKDAAPGGRINQLTQEEKADIARHVDQTIAWENAQAKKKGKKKPDTLFQGGPSKLLSDGSDKAKKEAEKAAKKAAAAAHKAAVKAADSILKLAKKTSDGIEKQLKTAEDSLKKLRDQFAEIRDAIQEAFSVDLFSSRSAKSFLRKATKNITKNSTVLANQKTIADKLGNQEGSSEFMRQLFESGNRSLIKNLAKQSAATLREVAAKFKESTDLASKIGTAVANAYMVGGKPLVTGIADVRDEVIKLRKELVMALKAVELAQKNRDKLKAAAGGIFSSATDLQVGEAGREVVVPLTRPKTALDLLLKSGALGLPTVAAHLGTLENNAQSQSMDYLRRLPTSSRFAQPTVKVVKERKVEQTFHIDGSKDPKLTAASVAARTAEHMDR